MSTQRLNSTAFPATVELKPKKLDLPARTAAAAVLFVAAVIVVVLAAGLLRIAGAVGLLGSGAATFWLVRRALRERPMLRLTPAGLSDEASGARVGTVPWDQVEHAVALSIVGRDLVGVVVTEPRAMLERVQPTRRGLARMHLENLSPATPVWIDAEGLMPAVELAHLINSYRAGWAAHQGG